MARALFCVNFSAVGGKSRALRQGCARAMTEIISVQKNRARDARPYAGPGTGEDAARHRASVRNDTAYAPTPLVAMPTEASRLGLSQLWIKNEGARLLDQGLGSFKPLGVMGALAHLRSRRAPRLERLVCASDGNFGRAVAWGAARAGVAATIFVPSAVSQGRVAAIESFGAAVVRVAGGYDRAMSGAAEAAAMPGVLEMTDTGYGDVVEIPMAIQTAYGVIAEEVLEALDPDAAPPTHVFVPTGVGGLVAGLVAGFDDLLGPSAPAVISVQPRITASLVASLVDGAFRGMPEVAGGMSDPPTIMVGLACETPSTTAWPVLRARLAHAVALRDDATVRAMRRLAAPIDGAPIRAGESGAAGYGALLAAAEDAEAWAHLDLGPESRVLVILTEAATDAAIYDRIMSAPAS